MYGTGRLLLVRGRMGGPIRMLNVRIFDTRVHKVKSNSKLEFPAFEAYFAITNFYSKVR